MATRRERAPPAQLEAYVLHRYDWSESSLILDVFTRERGRLAVVAKGAKRPTSQLRAVLLPFQRVHLTLGRSPVDEYGEIQVLRHAEWIGGPLLPAAALFQGFYLNELLLRLLARADPHPALYDAYAATLPALAHGDEQLAQAGLRAFELQLLHETGVLPDLAVTTLGQRPVQPSRGYALRAESGLVPSAEAGAGIDGEHWLALQRALGAGSIAELRRACVPCLAALRATLRQLLHYHLGSQRLRTREVMHSVQRLVERSTTVFPSPNKSR